jgi:hypothetical protein
VLPLCTIWNTGTPSAKLVAVLHCTAGDVLIGFVSLAFGLVALASPAWPIDRFGRVLLATVMLSEASW